MVFCGKRKRGNSAEWNSEYNQPEKIVWCVPYVPFCACIRAFNAYFSLIRWVQENSSFCLLISFICLYDVTWASVCASGCLTFHTQNNALSISSFSLFSWFHMWVSAIRSQSLLTSLDDTVPPLTTDHYFV